MGLSQLTDNTAKRFFQHPQALVESDEIGCNSRVWAFAHIMKGARIGENCNIGEHTYVECGVRLGNNVTVKNGVALWTGVSVEDDVFLGPYCVFTNDPNPRAYIKKVADSLLPTLVRSNATIGANATVLCGITIGRYAFVGAGAVVLRSVPDFALIVGNPGRQTGWMCRCAHKLDFPISAPTGAMCQCASCGSVFRKDSQTLIPQVLEKLAFSS
jgi:UDP-2-acetamido-3-amino-2,3-dideoxy-glucuronate N-acetyltransferase